MIKLEPIIKLRESRREAEILSQQLRHSSSPFMQLRRWIFGLSTLSALSMEFISLYQMGIISHLPDPPLPHINSDAIDASPTAYEKLETPDAVLGMVNYGVTMMLTAMGAPNRAETQPWIPLALVAKTGFDTYQAGRLYFTQKGKKVYCIYCILAATATALTVPLALPEAYRAIGSLIERIF
jgi:uncharacterized membrane protein